MFCFIPSEFNIASEDALSSVSSPSIDSSAIFQRTPGATYAGMSANELARQSAIMLRNVPCNDGQCWQKELLYFTFVLSIQQPYCQNKN